MCIISLKFGTFAKILKFSNYSGNLKKLDFLKNTDFCNRKNLRIDQLKLKFFYNF